MTERDPLFPVEPLDEANRDLLASVHPTDWINPAPAPRYHLVVVGGGTAGLVAAAGAAGLGARVALVERHLLGGDCLNVGCVPSKALIRAARAWHEARLARTRFGGPEAHGDGDFAAVMERLRRLRAGIAPHDGAERFRGLGVDVFLGQGRFVAADAVEVAGARLRFRRAAIATGARAAVPDVPGLASAGYRTNETIFNLTERPARLLVVGGGPIGCELAQAFARLGSAVTLVSRGRLLPREDEDVAAIVEQALVADGVRCEKGAEIASVRSSPAGKIATIARGIADEQRIEIACDEVLVAVGRTPNLDGLELDAAGVKADANGVVVDDRLRTGNRRIYACGDVASRFQFTHMADALARIVIQNALFFGRAKASALTVPWCTYTSPEVAHVGLTAADAEARGLAVATLTLPLADVDRAVLDGETAGFLRVHLEKGKDRIVGATLVAEHAGESIGELALAIGQGVGLGKLASVIHPYPTQAEVIKKAGDLYRRGALTPTVKRLFGWWFRVLG